MGGHLELQRRLVATVFAVSTLAVGGAAFAQDQAPADKPSSVEEVVVTGSRIPRIETDTLQPTVVTTEQKIDDSGMINLGNVLKASPLFQTYNQTTGDRASANQGDAGVTFANLYNLGSQRTLTLIDGKRSVGAASANSGGENGLQVDISAIPIGLVSRVETISVGGAPIYGSDAIAGTVNVILKNNFDGLEVEASGGITQHSDGANGRAQVLYGHNFDDGRGNVTLSAAYSRQDGITAQDRDYNVAFGFVGSIANPAVNVPVTGGSFIFASGFGRPSTLFGLAGVVPGSNSPFGFYTDGSGKPLTFDANGNLVPFDPGTPAGAVVFGAALVTVPPSSDNDSTREASPIVSPSRRTNFNGMSHYDITDHVTANLKFAYDHTDAQFKGIAPLLSVLGATADTQALFLDGSNPFLSPSTRSYFATHTNFLGGNGFWLNRELTDVASGETSITQDTYSVQGGFNGDFDAFGRNFKWDLTASHGQTTRTSVAPQVLSARMGFATDAVYADLGANGQINVGDAVLPTPAGLSLANFSYDPTNNIYREAGTNHAIVCRVRTTGGPAGANASDVSQCAPFNPFGAQNPQDALDYLTGQSFQRNVIKQDYVQGNVEGPLWRLPAGEMHAAAGFEIRKESASYAVDAAQQNGLYLGGTTAAPVTGDFTTKEIYGEIRVPLLSGEMLSGGSGFHLIDLLEFEGAVRGMDNNLAGSDITWTAGGRLQITRDLTFRGNKTHSVRQPAITELFAGVEPRFQSITDPCAVGVINSGPNPAQRKANCEQAVINAGLAANTAAADTFLSTFTSPLGGIPGNFSGNPNLKSEKADSWTVGAVLTPRAIPGFMATIDWVSIDIKGAIAALDGGGVASACYDNSAGLSNPYCAGITRGAGFRIVGFNSFYDNLNSREFAGLTLTARYTTEMAKLLGKTGSDWGDIGFDGVLFYLDHDRSSAGGSGFTDNAGGVGFERYRAQFGVNYAWRQFSGYLQTSYYAKSKVDPSDSGIFLYNDVPAYYSSDLSLRYNVTQTARVQLVINNLFDKKAPFNSFSYQFDRLGRRFQLGFNYRF